MEIEYDYLILKRGEPQDECYCAIELGEEELEGAAEALMEQNSRGLLTDLPEGILNKMVDAALDDAAEIYPNFSDEKAGFSIVLSRYLPEDILDYLPEELIENFEPEMFENADEE